MSAAAIAQLWCYAGCSVSTVAGALAFFPPEPTYTLRPRNMSAPRYHGAMIRANPALESAEELVTNTGVSGVSFGNMWCKRVQSRRGRPVVVLAALFPGARLTLLWSHGNAADLGMMSDLLVDRCINLRCNVVTYDYSGYGAAMYSDAPSHRCRTLRCCRGDGATRVRLLPTEADVYADAEAAFDAVVASGICAQPATSLVLYGQSIGSGPACWLATHRPCLGLVLHSAIASGLRVLTPSRALACLDIFDNVARLRSGALRVARHVLVIHGAADVEVPADHGRALLAALPDRYVQAPGAPAAWFPQYAGHNDVAEMFRGEYYARMRNFLAGLCREDSVQHVITHGGNAVRASETTTPAPVEAPLVSPAMLSIVARRVSDYVDSNGPFASSATAQSSAMTAQSPAMRQQQLRQYSVGLSSSARAANADTSVTAATASTAASSGAAAAAAAETAAWEGGSNPRSWSTSILRRLRARVATLWARREKIPQQDQHHPVQAQRAAPAMEQPERRRDTAASSGGGVLTGEPTMHKDQRTRAGSTRRSSRVGSVAELLVLSGDVNGTSTVEVPLSVASHVALDARPHVAASTRGGALCVVRAAEGGGVPRTDLHCRDSGERNERSPEEFAATATEAISSDDVDFNATRNGTNSCAGKRSPFVAAPPPPPPVGVGKGETDATPGNACRDHDSATSCSNNGEPKEPICNGLAVACPTTLGSPS